MSKTLQKYPLVLLACAAAGLILCRSQRAEAKGTLDPVGFWQCTLAKRNIYLAILSNGKLNLDGAATTYSISGSSLRVMQQGRWVTYPFKTRGKGRTRRLGITMPDRSQMDCRALGSGRESTLSGMLCSWSGASSSYAGTSISRSTRVSFDGKGNLSYANEGGFSGPDGLYHNRSKVQRGMYRVVGKSVFLVFPDGSAGVGRVHMTQRNGRITEIKYEGSLYAAALCK